MGDVEAMEGARERLEKPIDVHRYVNAQGYRVSRSTVYGHIERGVLGRHKGGGFDRETVDLYAAQHLKQVNGKTAPREASDLQHKLLEADLQKKRAQALHWETKARIERDLYIEKAQYNSDLAARAALFKSDLENLARSKAAGIVELVKGDSRYVPDLIEMLIREFERITGRYSVPKVWPRRTAVRFDEEELEA